MYTLPSFPNGKILQNLSFKSNILTLKMQTISITTKIPKVAILYSVSTSLSPLTQCTKSW